MTKPRSFEERHKALQAAVEDVRAGAKQGDAARKHRVRPAAVGAACVYAGVRPLHGRKTRRALELIALGLSHSEAARAVGCAQQTVSAAVNARGLGGDYPDAVQATVRRDLKED